MRENEQSIGQGSEFPITDAQREYMIQNTRTAFEVAKTITRRQSPLFLYGGTIRNLLLEAKTSIPDYDFIGDIDPDQIQRDFPNLVIGRWNEVQTMRLKVGNTLYDFTWAKDIQERLAMGDITISNLCMTEDGQVIDYFGGLESLAKKEIKMVDAEAKIVKDPVRILRAFRFAAELGFTIEESTLSAAIKNAYMLESVTDVDDEIWQILTLDHDIRAKVLGLLHQYGIDRHITYPDNVFETINIFAIEKDISRCPQIDEVARMFDTTTYLVGGAVRDMIWNKKVNDLDFKIHMSVEEIIRILEENGFTRSPDYHTAEHQYYVSTFAGVVGAVIGGVDIHLSQVDTTDIPTLISRGDVNFSCCVFNVHTKRIENPERIREIRNKEIRFANPENAKNDPLIVINALKQISRVPDVIIPEETRNIIEESIPRVVEFVRANPNLRYMIDAVCGNLNSEEVYDIFGGDAQGIFEGVERKKSRLVVSSPQHTSIPLAELTEGDKLEVARLLRAGYGKHFDESKVFSGNVNSVVIQRGEKGIQSCCLVDGERLYSAAAREGTDWIAIIADLAKNNYNVWCTVDCYNPKIQALCSIAGLVMETKPQIVRKILEAKSEKYRDISIYEHNGMLVFKKNNDPENYPQVLLRS